MLSFDESIPFQLTLLKQLVEIETPSHDKSALDRMGEFIASECRRMGARVFVHPQKEIGNLIEARFGSTSSPRKSKTDSTGEKGEEAKASCF